MLARPEHEFYVCRPVPIPEQAGRDLQQLRAGIADRMFSQARRHL